MTFLSWFHQRHFFVKAPFYLWMQNTMDPHHIHYVHKGGFGKLFSSSLPEDIRISKDKTRSSFKMRVRPEIVEKYRSRFGERTSKTAITDYFYHEVAYPFVSITSFLGIFYSFETTSSDSPDRCAVITRFYTREDLAIPKPFLDAAARANDQILEEDAQLCEAWAKTYKPKSHRNWMPGEERIKAYLEILENDPLYF